MKKTAKGRILAFVLALALVLSTLPTNIVEAASACDCNKITKLTAKTTGNMLREGQILTKSMVKKSVKVTAKYEGGKQKAKYTSYKVTNVGKTIKSTNGKFKVTITAGSAKKTVSVKVNKIKNIYIKQSKQSALVEGSSFDVKAFKEKTTVYASYKKGADKKLTTYTVSAPKKVTANKNGEFVVTVKYGKKKDIISIPVTKQQVVTEKPTEALTTEKPTTETPTTEAPTIETPTTETPTTETPTTEAPTTETPTTETPTTEAPTTKTVTVTITRNGDGKVTFNNESLEDNAVNKIVEEGTTCTVIATNTSEYKFVRWVDAEGKELSTDKKYSFEATENTTILAVFERVYTVTVNRVGGKGKATIDEESLDFYNNVATYTTVAGRYELAAVSTDDYNFVSWTDGNGKVLSTNPSYSVAVTTDVEVTVNFAEAEKTVIVTYLQENGSTLISEAIPFGETLAPPTGNLWRAEKTFAGWQIGTTVYAGDENSTEFYDADGNSLSDAIKAITSQKQNVEVIPYYVANPVQYFAVSITGGEIVSYTGDKNEAGNFSEGTHLYIKATVPDGKLFAGWTSNDTIQSYEEEYDFYVTSDVTISATFSEVPVKKEPIVHFTGSKYELYPDSYGVRLYMASEIPDNYTKIEWGFLYTNQDLSEDEMVLGGTAKNVVNTSTATGDADWIYDARFSASAWGNGTVVKIRIYATVQSTEGTKTVYSEVLSVELKSE